MSKLGIDHQHDGRRGIEPGEDPGVLKASGGIEFRGQERVEIYGWLSGLLCPQEYWVRKREEKGLLRQYAEKVSGMSRAQITRLIGRYKREGTLGPSLTGDTVSGRNKRARMWSCWLGWTRRMRP